MPWAPLQEGLIPGAFVIPTGYGTALRGVFAGRQVGAIQVGAIRLATEPVPKAPARQRYQHGRSG